MSSISKSGCLFLHQIQVTTVRTLQVFKKMMFRYYFSQTYKFQNLSMFVFGHSKSICPLWRRGLTWQTVWECWPLTPSCPPALPSAAPAHPANCSVPTHPNNTSPALFVATQRYVGDQLSDYTFSRLVYKS